MTTNEVAGAVLEETEEAPQRVRILYGTATGDNTVPVAGAATAVEIPAIWDVVSGQYAAVLVTDGGDAVILGPVDPVTNTIRSNIVIEDEGSNTNLIVRSDSTYDSVFIQDAVGAGANTRYIIRDDNVDRFEWRFISANDTYSLRRSNSSGVFQDTAVEIDGATGDVTIRGHQIGAWTSFTPSWGNLTIGNATVAAKYCYVTGGMRVQVTMTVGSTTSFTGSRVNITIPNGESVDNTAGSRCLGVGYYIDNASTHGPLLPIAFANGSTIELYTTAILSVNQNRPITWTTSDQLHFDIFLAL